MSYMQAALDSLIYAMVCMRHDLSQAISMLRRYLHDLGRGHWEVVKWILHYIKGIIDVDLIFEKDTRSKQECIGYVNSNYTRDFDKCRSIMGYMFTLSQAPVSWRSILQSIVALSTIEVEYMAMMEAMKEAI